MKRLIIEQLKEGFIFMDENDEKYAVSSGSLSKRVHAYFELTRPDSRKEIGTKNRIAPPAKVSEATKPETQGSKTPDSNSGGAIDNHKMERKTPFDDILPKLGTPDNNKLVQRGQCAEILETPGFDSPAAPLILQPSDLKLAAFEYDKSKMQKYKSLFFQEFPDGKVVLIYSISHYYTTKDLVMQIPFPFPRGSFSKENGWSSTVEQAFKMYRRHLFEKGQEQQVEKERREDHDDWKYRPMLKKDTKGNHGEDYEKIEGSLEE